MGQENRQKVRILGQPIQITITNIAALDGRFLMLTGENSPITGPIEIAAQLYMSGGDIKTDRYLGHNTNTFLGIGVCGAGNLTHTAGTEGWYNTGIGYHVMYAATKATENVAIGWEALRSLTTGVNNFGLGSWALRNTTIGGYNVAIGKDAMIANTSGGFNFALGPSAIRYNTTGGSNVAIGNGTLLRNTVGYYNIGIGEGANRGNQGGSGNVAIGQEAGGTFVLHSKSLCVFIGFQAGYNEITSNKLYIANSNTATPLIYGEFNNKLIKIHDYLYLPNIKSGATQGGAGANAGELWKTSGHASLPDNVIMIGV